MHGWNSYKKRITFCGISLLLTLAIVFCFPTGTPTTEEAPSSVPAATIPEDVPLQDVLLVEEPVIAPISKAVEAQPGFRAVIQEAVGHVASQKRVDEALLQELDSGIYTFQDPFVILDPYDMAPLSALALFTTDKPAQISIHVQGDTPAAEVDFTLDGYKTRIKFLFTDSMRDVKIR